MAILLLAMPSAGMFVAIIKLMSATFDGGSTADMDARPEAMVFNSSVSLKDSWTKIEGQDGGSGSLPLGRAPSIHIRIRRLTANSGEKCRLTAVQYELFRPGSTHKASCRQYFHINCSEDAALQGSVNGVH